MYTAAPMDGKEKTQPRFLWMLLVNIFYKKMSAFALIMLSIAILQSSIQGKAAFIIVFLFFIAKSVYHGYFHTLAYLYGQEEVGYSLELAARTITVYSKYKLFDEQGIQVSKGYDYTGQVDEDDFHVVSYRGRYSLLENIPSYLRSIGKTPLFW